MSVVERWFRPVTAIITLMKFVPVNTRTVLLVRRSDCMCRLHSLAKPVPTSGDIVPLLVEPVIESSERSVASYGLKVSTFEPESREITVKVTGEVYTSPSPYAVERKVYVEVVQFIRRFIKASPDEKRKMYEWANRVTHEKLVFMLMLSLLEQIEFDPTTEDIIPFSVKIREREYRGTRPRYVNYYVVYLAKVQKRQLIEVARQILELAGVKVRLRRRRKAESAGLLLIIESSKHESGYYAAYSVLSRLERDGKARKLAPKVYLISDIEIATRLVKLLRATGTRVIAGKFVPVELE